MKQLSSSEVNHLSKEDLAAIVLQMQKQIDTLNEKLAVANARLFGRSTEKLESLPGQVNLFNEAESILEDAADEPSIEQIVIKKKKQKGKRKDDLSNLPYEWNGMNFPKKNSQIFMEKADGSGSLMRYTASWSIHPL